MPGPPEPIKSLEINYVSPEGLERKVYIGTTIESGKHCLYMWEGTKIIGILPTTQLFHLAKLNITADTALQFRIRGQPGKAA